MKKFGTISILSTIFLFMPFLVFAAGACIPGAGNTGLCNPVDGFASNFPDFVTNLLKIFGVFAGGQAIIYVIFSGFKMVISQGDSEKVADAKSSLQWTLSGMLLIFLSFALVYGVSVFLGASDVNTNSEVINNSQVQNPITAPTFADLVERIITGFLGVAGTIALMMIIINGFRYIFAGGNEEQTESAKAGLQWAVIGLVIIALAYVIVVATAKLVVTVN